MPHFLLSSVPQRELRSHQRPLFGVSGQGYHFQKPNTTHKHTTHMKKTVLALLFTALGIVSAAADDVIKDVMKKYHKPEDALCKKVGKGEATSADLSTLLKSYEAMKASTPPKGDKAVWARKCDDLISAVKKVQAKDASGVSDFKKAVNCKACHDGFKGK